MAELTEGQRQEVLAAMASGRKIEAIRLYREYTGCGLKEAKEAVESLDGEVERVPPRGRPTVERQGRSSQGGWVLLLVFGVVLAYIYVTGAELMPWRDRESGAPARSQAMVPKEKVLDPFNTVVPVNGELRIRLFSDFRYFPKGFPMGLSSGQSEASGLTATPAEVLRAEPGYRSPNHLYGYLTLGNGADNRFTFVIDDLDADTWILHVDRNNNEDLTDDGPPLGNQGSDRLAAEFSLEVPLREAQGERTIPYQVWFWVKKRQGRLSAHFYARCHYRGRVELDGASFDAVAFETRRHDGLYRDSGLYIDLNRDGKLTAEEGFMDGDRLPGGGERLVLDYP